MDKAIIIDLDNVIIDTAVRRHSILVSILKNNSPTLEDVRNDFMLKEYLGDKTSPLAQKFFSVLSSKNGIINNPAPTYDNASQVIQWIDSQQIKVFILSGRPQSLLDVSKEELRRQNINVDNIEFIFMPDKIDKKIPDYDIEKKYKYNSLMEIKQKYNVIAAIGDQPTDIEAFEEASIVPILFMGSVTSDIVDALKNKTKMGMQICDSWKEIREMIEGLENSKCEMMKFRDTFANQYAKWLGDLDNKCMVLVAIAAVVAGVSGKIYNSNNNFFLIIPFLLSIISLIFSLRSLASRYTSGEKASSKIGFNKLGQYLYILFDRNPEKQYRKGDAIDYYYKAREMTCDAQRNVHLRFFYSKYETYDIKSLKNLHMLELRAANYSKIYAERGASITLIWSIIALGFCIILSKVPWLKIWEFLS